MSSFFMHKLPLTNQISVIDTCVVLDYLQKREPFFDDALNIAIGRANNEFEGYITANSITDLYYIVHRHTHSNLESRKIINGLTNLFLLTDTFAEDCINALHSDMTDYEDAVMSETAHRINADYIVTRNTKDYIKSKVPAINPSDFLMKIDGEI